MKHASAFILLALSNCAPDTEPAPTEYQCGLRTAVVCARYAECDLLEYAQCESMFPEAACIEAEYVNVDNCYEAIFAQSCDEVASSIPPECELNEQE